MPNILKRGSLYWFVAAVLFALWMNCRVARAQDERMSAGSMPAMPDKVMSDDKPLTHDDPGIDSGIIPDVMRNGVLIEIKPLPSWKWVHAGVGAQVMGNFADWATSWKQGEGNKLLADQSGPWKGKLYRTGSYRKIGLSAGITGVSYLVGWKWPKTRKAVGIVNMVIGAEFTGVAVSNVVRNPYYR